MHAYIYERNFLVDLGSWIVIILSEPKELT